MKISVVGTGYVGLVSGACFAEVGIDVTCVDIDIEKIENLKKGIIPIYEPGLQEIVERNVVKNRLHFTTSLAESLDGCEVVFSAVGTPPDEDGSADLKYVLDVAREVGRNMNQYLLMVTKSTVPVGTAKLVKNAIQEALNERGLNIPFDVASNPEFLKEGNAIDDFLKPVYCHYRKPYFALIDFGIRRLHIYEKEKGSSLTFKKIKTIQVLALADNIKLLNADKILMSGFKKSQDNKQYDLYILNVLSEKIQYILPSYQKYGCRTEKEYEKIFDKKIAPLSLQGYCDFLDENIVFLAWGGKAKITRINIDKNEIKYFGETPQNYRVPEFSEEHFKMYRKKNPNSYLYSQQMSFVTGIFVDDNFIGLLYSNFGSEGMGWQAYVQFYDHNGELLCEQILKDAVDVDKWANASYYYDRPGNILHFLSHQLDDEYNDVYKIIKFKIDE